jgi:hypothetical protein
MIAIFNFSAGSTDQGEIPKENSFPQDMPMEEEDVDVLSEVISDESSSPCPDDIGCLYEMMHCSEILFLY